MRTITRREFLQVAAATGASAAWGRISPLPSTTRWRERRDLYPEGVASGDPRFDGVILWTRHPGTDAAIPLTVEIAEDVSFKRAAKARALSNPDVAPHLTFLDEAGHGYAIIRASADHVDCEFVCIPRPVARATTSDGGPLRYRMVQRARRWSAGERPHLERTLLTGETRIDV